MTSLFILNNISEKCLKPLLIDPHMISEKVRELGAILLRSFDMIMAIAPVEMVLKGLGHSITLGSGVAKAQELLRWYPSNESLVTDLRF